MINSPDYFKKFDMSVITTKHQKSNFDHFSILDTIKPQNLQHQKITEREKLLEKGTVCNKIFLVKKGLIKQYTLHKNKKKVQNLFRDGEIATNLRSYLNGDNSDFFLEAIAGSEIIVLDNQLVLSLCCQIPDFQYKLIQFINKTEADKLKDTNFLALMALYKNLGN